MKSCFVVKDWIKQATEDIDSTTLEKVKKNTRSGGEYIWQVDGRYIE